MLMKAYKNKGIKFTKTGGNSCDYSLVLDDELSEENIDTVDQKVRKEREGERGTLMKT